MIALKIEALAAIRDGPDENRLVGAKVITGIALIQLLVEVAANRHEIEHRGREARYLPSLLTRDIANHRQRLQVNLGTHDGRSEAEHAAALKPLECVRENQKIAIAGVAIGRAVAVGMLMRDVVADAGVYRSGNRKTIRGRQDAQRAVGKFAEQDAAADILTQAKRQVAGFTYPIVKLARLAPEAEFAGPNVAVHALRCRPDAGQLIIVDGARAVHREVIDGAALHQIYDVPAHAGADHVSAED